MIQYRAGCTYREDELDGLLAVPGLPTYLATIRGLQASLAAFFNFFSWTYQVEMAFCPSTWPPSADSMPSIFNLFSWTYQVEMACCSPSRSSSIFCADNKHIRYFDRDT